MSEKLSGEKKTAMGPDRFLSESGLQGGKVLSRHMWLVCFVVGIPFLCIGLISLVGIAFEASFPSNSAFVLASVLVAVIGGLLVFSGYSLYQSK